MTALLVFLALVAVGVAYITLLVLAIRPGRQGYAPGCEYDPVVRAACRRHHPGKPCRPGENHPAAGAP